jgi:hypothetical protein
MCLSGRRQHCTEYEYNDTIYVQVYCDDEETVDDAVHQLSLSLSADVCSEDSVCTPYTYSVYILRVHFI